jgi:hypothetical protein
MPKQDFTYVSEAAPRPKRGLAQSPWISILPLLPSLQTTKSWD